MLLHSVAKPERSLYNGDIPSLEPLCFEVSQQAQESVSFLFTSSWGKKWRMTCVKIQYVGKCFSVWNKDKQLGE